MKKYLFAIMFLLVLGIAAMSCRASQPPCPAYPTAQVQVDNPNTNVAR